MNDISSPGEGGKPLSIGLGALLFIVALVVLASVFARAATSGEGQGAAILEWMKGLGAHGVTPTPASTAGASLTAAPTSTPSGAMIALPVAQPPAPASPTVAPPTVAASLQPTATLTPTVQLSPTPTGTARATGSPVPAPQITLQRPTRVPRPTFAPPMLMSTPTRS